MARRYEQVGFSPAHGDGIPDHIAAELSFLAALAHQRIVAEDSESQQALRELEHATLADMGWLDEFDSAVATQDGREETFATLVRLTRIVVAWDAKRRGSH